MKTRIYFFSIVVICIVAASLLIFAKAFCEDDDSLADTLYTHEYSSHYYQLPEDIASRSSIFYQSAPDLSFSSSIIVFLAQKEKSPPHF